MKLKFKLLMFTLVMASSSIACATFFKKHPPLATVESVALDKYVGQWYAVTSLPQFFTRRCVSQEAVYGLNSNIEISVKNICTKKNGKRTNIIGFAKATEISGVLALKFTSGIAGFFGASGDYNIIKLDSEYRYALIGAKDRKSLWLLARTKEISDDVYDEYIEKAKELGYDVSELVDSKF